MVGSNGSPTPFLLHSQKSIRMFVVARKRRFEWSGWPYGVCVRSSSTIEVAHLRFFVSEKRGSLPANRRNVNLDFEKKTFCRLGPWDYSPRCIMTNNAEVTFRKREEAP